MFLCLFTSVTPHVFSQISLLNECMLANPTHCFLLDHAPVALDVINQGRPVPECPAANRTTVRFFTGMNSHVAL